MTVSLSWSIRSILLGYYVSFYYIFMLVVDIPVPLSDTAPLPERAIVNTSDLARLISMRMILFSNAGLFAD